MKIIVTGGSGFVGRHLTESLSKEHNVSILDICPPKNNVNFIEANIINFNEIKNILNDFDIVIHLAALVGVESSENDPIKTLEFNINGTKNVLEACRNSNIKKIIFSSSSEIYGQPLSVPIKAKASGFHASSG